MTFIIEDDMQDKSLVKKELLKNLTLCQQGFFKSSIFDTFHELKIDQLLNSDKSATYVAEEIKCNKSAVERFLNAAASLKIIFKNENETYIYNPNGEVYTSINSINLVWFIKNKIPDLLYKNSLSETEIQRLYGDDGLKRFNSLVDALIISKDAQMNYILSSGLEDYLISTSSEYIGPVIIHYEKLMYPMFNKKGLIGALKSGRSQWNEIFGKEVNNPFDLYKNEPELLKVFTEGLHNLNREDDAIHAENLNLDGVKNLLDIGGGSGAWSIQLLRKSNNLTEICIYELPDAIPMLSTILHKYAPDQARIKFIPGSFLNKKEEAYLEGLGSENTFDLISLCWILHDWSDVTNVQILKKAYIHLKQDGRLVILETILPDNKVGTTNILDISMLLQTEGRERTFREYRELIKQAGFRDVCWSQTSTRRQMLIAKK